MRYHENMNGDFNKEHEELNKLLESLFFNEFESKDTKQEDIEIDVLPIVPPEDDIEDGYFYY